MEPCAEIRRVAELILDDDPSPPVRYRLLRDALHSADRRDLDAARRAAADSKWVVSLTDAQTARGGWSRFHTADSSRSRAALTTEVAVRRALALGSDVDTAPLASAARYMADILAGTRSWPDPPEENDRWPTGVQLITAATLCLVDPTHPALDRPADLWSEIARRTFAGGVYSAEAEESVHRELTGATVTDSYLTIDSRYAVALLASRPGLMPPAVESAYIKWLWDRPAGIMYLEVPLSIECGLADRDLARWLASHELLSGFDSARTRQSSVARFLWSQQGGDGMWDFGGGRQRSDYFPLSDSWRRRQNRKHDWTARALAFLATRHGCADG